MFGPRMRKMMDISQQGMEWMQVCEKQSRSAATCRGGMGIDDTTLIERVESSFVAAVDHLLVHLNKYCMFWGYPDSHAEL